MSADHDEGHFCRERPCLGGARWGDHDSPSSVDSGDPPRPTVEALLGWRLSNNSGAFGFTLAALAIKKRSAKPKSAATAKAKSQITQRNKGKKRTLDLERVSPRASTQTYSAIIWPFWSSFRYLLSCGMHVSLWSSDRLQGNGGVVQSPFWR